MKKVEDGPHLPISVQKEKGSRHSRGLQAASVLCRSLPGTESEDGLLRAHIAIRTDEF